MSKKMSRNVKQTFFLLLQKMHDMEDIPQFTLYILVLAIYDIKEGNQHFYVKVHYILQVSQESMAQNQIGLVQTDFFLMFETLNIFSN